MPLVSARVNTSARAVMPNGKVVSRRDLLQQLGLNPSTPPDAWLVITKCGTNASALNIPDAKRLLQRGTISVRSLDPKILAKVRPEG